MAFNEDQGDHLSDHTYIKDGEDNLDQSTENTESIQCESCKLLEEIDPEAANNPNKLPCEKCQEIAGESITVDKKSGDETESTNDSNAKRKYVFKTQKQNCPHCSKVFHSQKRLDKHLPVCKKNLICPFCNKDFSGNGKLAYMQYQTHYYTHVDTKPFICDVCSRGFIRKADLDRHKIIHTDNYSPQRCTQCGAVFASEANLSKHMHKHERLTLRCEKCGQHFARQSTFDKHITVCQTETSCEICGKVFKCLSKNLKSRYQEHMFTHTGEKPYKCQFCDRGFRDRSTRRKHERTHTGEKPYPCTVCNRAFSQLRLLRNHVRTHTGEKPYACELCPLSFAKSCNLKYHMRVHTKEKPYSCALCKRSFTQSGTYHKHMRRHTDAERETATMLQYQLDRAEKGETLSAEESLQDGGGVSHFTQANSPVMEFTASMVHNTNHEETYDVNFSTKSMGAAVNEGDVHDGTSNMVVEDVNHDTGEDGDNVVPAQVSSESTTTASISQMSGEEITIIVGEGDSAAAALATIDVDQISSILASCS